MHAVRVLVLWIRCYVISAEEDARWAQEETEKLRACDGVLDLTLHRVEKVGTRHVRQWDWCLELRVADGETMRQRRIAEFVADLRLLGTRPAMLALPEAV
jgi:hypothetical protein